MSFAYKTPVQSPKGPRPIEDYAVGDPVLAASQAGTGWAWATDAVGFSSGTGPGAQSTMVIIRSARRAN